MTRFKKGDWVRVNSRGHKWAGVEGEILQINLNRLGENSVRKSAYIKITSYPGMYVYRTSLSMFVIPTVYRLNKLEWLETQRILNV